MPWIPTGKATMTNQQNDPRPKWEGEGRPFKLPEHIWPLTIGIGFVSVFILLRWGSMGHDHRSEGRFVGPNACKECHAQQFESWAQTRMANTFDVLLPGMAVEAKRLVGLDPDVDYSREAACLSCHTTGFGLVGGFVSIEETPEMAGVTCESCHGHGGTYVNTVMDPRDPSFSTEEAVAAGLVYPPTEAVCSSCHNAASPFVGMDYAFDFEERVRLGTHDHFPLKYEHSR